MASEFSIYNVINFLSRAEWSWTHGKILLDYRLTVGEF